MSNDTDKKVHIGQGILRPGARPIRVHVDESGEYWLCDAGIDPKATGFRAAGCMSHSETHMAEGG